MTTSPRMVGHLVELRLTTGRDVLLDPDDVAEVSSHGSDSTVTVVRCRGQRYLYHVAADYQSVRQWLAYGLDACSD